MSACHKPIMHQVLKKLQYKNSPRIIVHNYPENLKKLIAEFSEYTNVIEDFTTEKQQMILIFCYDQNDISKYIDLAITNLEDDALLWLAYPKKTSKKYQSDITRDIGWKAFEKYNFRPVRQIAIDEDWSALRFRHVDFVK